jgi:hypothetical protein
LRAGAYVANLSADIEEEGINYDGTVKLGGYGLLVDFFPMKGKFHLTAGILNNRNGVELEAVPTAPSISGEPSMILTRLEFSPAT